MLSVEKHLKTIYRNFKKEKASRILNILGLTVGMAVSLLLIQFYINEIRFDRFHVNAERIFSIKAAMQFDGEENIIQNMSPQFGPVFSQSSVSVEDYCRIKRIKKSTLSSDQENYFYDEKVIFADPSFLSMFSFQILQGNAKSIFNAPNEVLITKEVSKKYFGDQEPLGKFIWFNNRIALKIVGVVESPPAYSSIQFSIIGSFLTVPYVEEINQNGVKVDHVPYEATYVGIGAYQTFVSINSESDGLIKDLTASIPSLVKKSGFSIDNTTYYLEPLIEMHENISSIAKYKNIIVGIALIILILALLNFINLTTTTILKRAKEGGLKRILGADRIDLITQIYLETSIIVTIAFATSFGLIEIIRFYIGRFLNITISHDFIYNPHTVVACIVVLLLCSIIAGAYPAIVFSSFKPVEILKGKKTIANKTNMGVQMYFTVFQFSISSLLIVSCIIIYEQVKYLKSFDLGFDTSETLVVPLENIKESKYPHLQKAIETVSGVRGVSSASTLLFREGNDSYSAKSLQSNQDISLNVLSIGDSFVHDFNLQWAIQPESNQDLYNPQNVILNERAVTAIQLDSDPLNKTFLVGDTQFKVVGVLKDFNYASLHNGIDPLMINVLSDTVQSNRNIYVKFDKNADVSDMLIQLEQKFKQTISDKPFEYYFLDNALSDLYVKESQMVNIFSLTTAVSILLAALGLLGYCSFTLEMKTKEIGIRKFLGASFYEIMKDLVKIFVTPVAFSFLIAFPLSWYFMKDWLEGYENRIDFDYSVFIIASLFSCGIVILTVISKTVRAAMLNPIKFIREE